MWHKTAPELSKYFTVIVADLRGYGDSLVLPGGTNHKNYSKREMAKDMVQLMSKLNDLKEKGIISQEEFEKAKNKLLNN